MGTPSERQVSRTDLFLAFLKIGMLGFGGVAPWARHVIVQERRWLTDKDYAALLGIGQVLPGPNTMNAAIMIGDRFQGAGGAVLAVLGMMAMPLVILVALASLYAAFAAVPEVRVAIAAAASAAAGLVIGTAVKMAVKLKPTPLALVFGALSFVAIGLLRLPLLPTVLALMALSVLGAAWGRRA
ncbi:chromate transporter [Reyranella sp. CPCC 100927]|uniref:chromate transporter n=1 Tax=Reyranella sp. CPCC 100927 TaxID=2599616 RepID=UPI0011B5D0CB|nr:chromate transporter [Reyranella sp. CPCC 100927]TWT11379.1 chromate transporter [Reyranella sp. CPCC 100927]